MTVELEEIRDFLAGCAPFSELPVEALNALPGRLTMRYVRRGDDVLAAGRANDDVFLIRSGLVDVFDASGTLLDRRDAGDHLGYSTLLSREPSLYTMTAVEDSVLLVMHRDVWAELMERHECVARYYGGENARIRAVASSLRSTAAGDALRTRIADLMAPDPVTAGPATSIREAAAIMTERGVSSLLIVDPAAAPADGAHPSGLVGILTDRDLRRRVVVAGVDPATPVSAVMTPDPEVLAPEVLAFEAMLLMAERGYHHLPVADAGELRGMLVIGDLMRTLHTDPVYATAALSRKASITEIAEVAENSRRTVGTFIDRGFGPDEISRLLTANADAVARRLLVLAEESLGEPPVPYAFVVLGSQGRREMGLASDQDNALILDDAYDEAAHGPYFADLAEFVCAGLADCGYPLCPGDMMATNPAWRMTESAWESTFHQWITAPEPDALLHAQTFFDIRGIHGATALVDALRGSYVPIAANSPRLHAHLAKLAAHREPPLGVFRGLVLEKDGEHANTLDLKKGGTAAVVQMARLFALAAGLPQLGTRERLIAAAGAGSVSRRGAADLGDAYEFLTTVLLEHQAHAAAAGAEPDNHLHPRELSKLERQHLRDAFGVVRRMQQGLAAKYPIHTIG
ncbi:DUF294 nucleotidyltransferase-like domain-containing protein [Corynebacterium sphenisci]|uniref:DUF294 nucleotidyltransferase-like domain-containing protein n=1 Tax=Corynebacterium sphenisci TaxID=191493 RepID=UPI0026DED366|nr:DUF294 nucleotidyltransferase-like domain-containing protein [Corynebacterium sphenisci]MDO5731787.1 DUF294 nucleotidyltransferase-like domain-containing protein [Corynebacterium sphenisci]